jgi:hypothetical protein
VSCPVTLEVNSYWEALAILRTENKSKQDQSAECQSDSLMHSLPYCFKQSLQQH